MKTLDLAREDAACTLWLAGSPRYRGLHTASLGRFQCATAEAGATLLDRALAELSARGFRYVVGPMDGDTWHRYRLVVESDGSPPFLFEPTNPESYPRIFMAAGFEVIGRYASARAEAADLPPRRSSAYETRLARAGIRVRDFDPARAEDELRGIFRLSLEAFADNFLYTPIGEEDFLALYRPLLPRLVPRLIPLAEDGDGRLVAFLFAIPDWLEGPSPRTLVVKTYASRFPGLGGYLLDGLHGQARDLGFSRIIHALMHEDNVSRHNSSKYARPFRRYALFGRALP